MATDLIARLRERLGPGGVIDGAEAGGFARDWTGGYSWTPLAVARPGSTAEVAAVMRLAHETGTPVVPVGGNTGLNGGTSAEGALMLSLGRMNRIRSVNAAAQVMVAEAGVVLEELHRAAAAEGLAFPLSFGAKGSAMVGGFLSTNAGGSNVLRYGTARALCLGIEAVTAAGEVMDLMGALRKDNTGYDLRDLLIGAEGTLGVITAAVLKLVPAPKAHATALVGMTDLAAALGVLNRLQEETGGAVEAFEYMPDIFMARMARFRPDLACPFPPAPVNVLVEIATTAPDEAAPGPDGTVPLTARLEAALAEAVESGQVTEAVVARSEAQRGRLWAMREAAAEVTLNTRPLVDSDIALPLDRVADYLERTGARLAALDPGAGLMVVGHLGDGNLHYTVYPTRGDPALLAEIRAAVAAEAVALAGSFSAEHGVGISKRATMAACKDPVALAAMRAIKAVLDPKGILNPGKLLPG